MPLLGELRKDKKDPRAPLSCQPLPMQGHCPIRATKASKATTFHLSLRRHLQEALRPWQQQASSAKDTGTWHRPGALRQPWEPVGPRDDPCGDLAGLQTLAPFHLNTLLHVPDIGYSS